MCPIAQLPLTDAAPNRVKQPRKGSGFVTFRCACLAGAGLCVAAMLGVLGRSPPSAGRVGASAAAATEIFPVASDVRVGGDDKQTRFVMDLSRKFDVATFTLADPYRVVVDLPQVSSSCRPDRRARPRPDQGLPLRPHHAGRLAHRARHQGAGADRQGLHAGRRPPASRRGWCSISPPPTAPASCTPSRSRPAAAARMASITRSESDARSPTAIRAR